MNLTINQKQSKSTRAQTKRQQQEQQVSKPDEVKQTCDDLNETQQ